MLRDWRDPDVDAYARICADPQVMRYMHPPRALTSAEVAYDALRLREHWQRHGFGHWVVEERESGRMVGRTGIKRHDDWPLDPENTEAGWLYERAAWGKGYATEAALEVVRFCLEELEPAGGDLDRTSGQRRLAAGDGEGGALAGRSEALGGARHGRGLVLARS